VLEGVVSTFALEIVLGFGLGLGLFFLVPDLRSSPRPRMMFTWRMPPSVGTELIFI